MVNRSDERIGVEKINTALFDQHSKERRSAQCPRHICFSVLRPNAGINQRDGAEARDRQGGA